MLSIRRSNSSRLLENNKTMPAFIPNWSEFKSPNALIRRRSHHSAVVYKNNLYVYGGYEPNIGIIGDMMKFGKDQTWKKQWSPANDQNQNEGPQRHHLNPNLCLNAFQNPLTMQKAILANCKSKGVKDNFKTSTIQEKQRGRPAKSDLFQSKGNLARIKQQQQEITPEPRHCHSAVVYNDRMYVFGGLTKPLENNNELWSYEFSTKKWRLHQEIDSDQNRPLRIDSHRAQIYGNKMIVYGGFSDGRFLGNVWSLDLDTMKWEILFDYQNFQKQELYNTQRSQNQNCSENLTQQLQQKAPRPRSNGTINLLNGCLYIFGGTNMDQKFHDLWKFDLSTRSFTIINASNRPVARSHHSSVIYKNFLIVFGGIKAKNHQMNDMIYLELENQTVVPKWKIIWADTQQSIVGYTLQKQLQRKQSHKKTDLANSSRRSFSKNNLNSAKSNNSKRDKKLNNAKQALGSFLPSLISSTIPKISNKKYRTQLKDVNYYNNNIPNILDRDVNKRNNVGKSLIANLLRMASVGESKNYSSSLENLSNSIMLTQNLNKSNFVENLCFQLINGVSKLENPRARDGHSCSLIQGKFLLIFGGDQHMASYNSLILIDLQNLIRTTIENQEEEKDSNKQVNINGLQKEVQNMRTNRRNSKTSLKRKSSIGKVSDSAQLYKTKMKKTTNISNLNRLSSTFSGFKAFGNSTK